MITRILWNDSCAEIIKCGELFKLLLNKYNWKWPHRIIFSRVNATLWYASPLTRSYSSLKFDPVVQIDLLVEEDRSCLHKKNLV